jgi:hypothetical protein
MSFVACLAAALLTHPAFAQATSPTPPAAPAPAAPAPAAPAPATPAPATTAPVVPAANAPPLPASGTEPGIGAAPNGTLPTNGSAPTSSSATAPPPPVVPVAPAAPAPPPAKPFFPVLELLPPSAYPDPKTGPRGIVGGSLWLVPDLQGMQWPYYPKTGLGISGSGWVDTGIREFNAGEATATSPGLLSGASKGTQFVQQSRFVLRATPTWAINDKFFVQAQTEFVAAKIDTSLNSVFWGADDAWIRFGWWNKFDILLGRFQAWEVYHYGMGLDLYTLERNGANDDSLNAAPQIYGLTYMYLRQDVIGQGAVHLYPTDWLRFEVGFQYGAANSANQDGVRPVGIAELPIGHHSVIRFKGGAEFLQQSGVTEGTKTASWSEGAGGSVQAIFDPYVEFGFNGAWGRNDARTSSGQISPTGRNQTYSLGGFANVRIIQDLLVGAGFNYTYFVDSNYQANVKRNDNDDQLQPYGAIQYLLWKHLFIKAVVAYAKADLNPVPMVSKNTFENEMWSARLRLLYLL